MRVVFLPLYFAALILTGLCVTSYGQCIDPDLAVACESIECPTDFIPVCGCDEVSYDNGCYAECIGNVTEWVPGTCDANVGADCMLNPDFLLVFQQSITSGEMPPNSAINTYCIVDLSEGDADAYYYTYNGTIGSTDENPCGLSVPSIVDGEPVTESYEVCLYIYNTENNCIASKCIMIEPEMPPCIDEELIADPDLCEDNYVPVCGCDGQSYPNICYAESMAGIVDYSEGICSECQYAFSSSVSSTAVPDCGLSVEIDDQVYAVGVIPSGLALSAGQIINFDYLLRPDLTDQCAEAPVIEITCFEVTFECPEFAICDLFELPKRMYVNAGESISFNSIDYLPAACLDPLRGFAEDWISSDITSGQGLGISTAEGQTITYTASESETEEELITYQVCYTYSAPIVNLCFGIPEEENQICFDQLVYITTVDGDCIDAAQIETFPICFDPPNPVCGCDGITYNNECAATSSGVTSFEAGSCEDLICEAEAGFLSLESENICSTDLLVASTDAELAEGYVYRYFVIQEGVIVDMATNAGLLNLPLGPSCLYGLIYQESNPPNLDATEIADLDNEGACYDISNCHPINVNEAIEYSITTEPFCASLEQFGIGITVTGGSGEYLIGYNSDGSEVNGVEGVEETLFYFINNPPAVIVPQDLHNGCSNDYELEIEAPDCEVPLPCGVADPINDLSWLFAIWFTDEEGCVDAIYQYTYLGDIIFFVQTVEDCNGSSPSANVYNCLGQQICYVYGDGQGPDCPDLLDEVSDELLLWVPGCDCPAVVDPVCGSDGNTYENACLAECAGYVWTPGPCETDCVCPVGGDPVCGADGVTYENSCFADCAEVEWIEGACDDCICPVGGDPVCGVDGITYENSCFAQCAEVEWIEGACDDCICPVGGDPVCGADGITYENECYANCAGVDSTLGACDPCDCPAILEIVCGEDGEVYLNSCEAECAGVAWTPGDCPDPCQEEFSLCTLPLTPIEICPEFCNLDSEIADIQTGVLFQCSVYPADEANCFTYVPLPAWEGVDTLTLMATDLNGNMATNTYLILTTEDCTDVVPSTEPEAVDDVYEVDPYSTIDLPVLLNDSDEDGDEFYICDYSQPFNGSLSFNEENGFFTYSPDPGFIEQTDLFSYEICDDDGNESMAIVTLLIGACEEGQVDFCTEPLTSIPICPMFCNPNAVITNIQTLFSCSINSQSDACFSYIPLPAFEGDETLTVTACDVNGICEEVVINVFVGDCEGDYEVDHDPETNKTGIVQEASHIQIFDIYGRLVLSEAFCGNVHQHLESLAPVSLYAYRLLSEQGIPVEAKLIVR